MKKIYIVLCLVFVAFVMVFAGETIKMLRIYKDGKFTAIPLANIDSINHSKYGVDSVLNTDYTTSVIDAIDSLYKIPFSSIDSCVVADVDVEQFQNSTESIRKYLEEQEEQHIDQFQENLLSWLKSKEDVETVTLNELKDKITVKFKSGMVFCVNFMSDQDIVQASTARVMMSEKDENKQSFYDATTDDEEEIVKPDILYIKGNTMNNSNYPQERAKLKEIHDGSPIGGILKFTEGFEFINENFSKYGLIILSQVHGDKGRSGKFQIEDQSSWWKEITAIQLGLNVDVNGEKICRMKKNDPYVCWVYPKYFGNKIDNNIVYGAYCYSSDLYRKGYNLKRGTGNMVMYGYDTDIWYRHVDDYPATDSLITRMDKFFNGDMLRDAVCREGYWLNWNYQKPFLSHQNSKLRYFSISTGDITDEGKLKGSINGYKNLKSSIKYYAYIFGKDEELDPVYIPSKGNEIHLEDDGTFTYDLAQSLPQNEGNEYQVVVGFTYAGKYYYGEIKTFELENVNESPCSDNNHPHWVNLGLPSGTKWCCCNEGASIPEAKGLHYNFGVISTAPSYDQLKELIDNTNKIWTTLNGVKGVQFIGTNGNSIFLPAAGFYTEGEYMNYTNRCDYWSSTPHETRNDRARKMVLNEGVNSVVEASINYYYRYDAASVRSVR